MALKKHFSIIMAFIFTGACVHKPAVETLLDSKRAPSSVDVNESPIRKNLTPPPNSGDHLSSGAFYLVSADTNKNLADIYKQAGLSPSRATKAGQIPPWFNKVQTAEELQRIKKPRRASPPNGNLNDKRPHVRALAKVKATSRPSAKAAATSKNKNYTPHFISEEDARKKAASAPAKASRQPQSVTEKSPKRQPQSSGCESLYDDYFEPNDYSSSAKSLVNFEGQWLSSYYTDSWGVQADDDWYQIYVDDSYRDLVVDLRYWSSCTDIDLAIYDANGTLVDSEVTGIDGEYISLRLSKGGTYYIKVYYGNDWAYYDLMWETSYSGPTVIPDDSYEDNDSTSWATDLRGWEGRDLSSLYGYGIARDSDYYRIQALPGTTHLNVNVAFWDDQGDIELELLNSSGSVVASSRGNSNNESITYPVTTFGDYYIRVYPYSSSEAGNNYNLNWYHSGTIWTEDSYEYNDTMSSAKPISVNSEIRGNQYNDDWFKFTVSDSYRHLKITLDFTHSYGDIDLQFYDSSGTRLESKSGSGDREFIERTVSKGGTYYVRVHYGNKGNPYSLWINPYETGPSDDSYEPNDAYTSATDLTQKNGIWLSNINGLGIQKNDDYYRIYVNPDLKNLMVDLIFTNSQGNLDLDLLNEYGQLVTTSNTFNNGEQINIVLPQAGKYFYLRVKGPSAGQTYDLKWTAQPALISASDRIMNWAEFVYPQFFPKPAQPGTYQIYTYRYYSTTGNFLATTPEGRVIVHNGSNWNFLDVGSINDYLPAATAAGF